METGAHSPWVSRQLTQLGHEVIVAHARKVRLIGEIMWIVVALLFANTFLGVSLSFGAKYFLTRATLNLQPCEALAEQGVQYHAPEIVCWYASRSIAIQFVLLALMAAIFIIFKNHVRYIPRK
jgi:hypothetical protein